MENLSQKEGYYPYQASIDAYGNGGFRFAEMSHKGSILCLPSGMHAWPVVSTGDVHVSAFDLVWNAIDDIDVLFIGMGEDIAAIDPQLREKFKSSQIIVEAVSTSSAISTYNIMLAERRAVAAALVAVERTR